MAADLDEIRGRLAHVSDEIDRVSHIVNGYFRRCISFTTEPFSIAGTYSVAMALTEDVPLPVRSLVGSTANELRAVLDELVCRLAVRNGKSMNGNYFPASKDKTMFEDKGMEQIRKLSQEDKAKIIDLAPYGGGKTHLHLLHAADLKRKHQPLSVYTPELAHFSLGGFGVGGGGKITSCWSDHVFIEDATFYPNRNLGGLAGGSPQLVATGIPFELGVHVVPRLVYEDPETIRGLDVVESLRLWLDETTSVVERFG